MLLEAVPTPVSALPQVLDVASLHARREADLLLALEQAEARARAADQARREAEQERHRLRSELMAAEAAKTALWTEKTALSNEVDVLMRRIEQLVVQLSEATSRDLQEVLVAEVKRLGRQLDERNRTLFGSTSERRGRPPGDNDNNSGDNKKNDDAKKKRKKRTGAARTPQPKLQTRLIEHKLSAEQQHCGCKECEGNLVEMRGQTEDSEVIGVVRPKYFLGLHQRSKYRCTDCGWLTTAPGPDKLTPGGRYDIDVAVQVAVDKYGDALPLARQVRRMKRAGLTTTSQALWDQLQLLYLRLLPVYLALHDQVLKAEVCFADESPWRLMPKGGGSKRWWLWSVSDGHLVFFQLVTSRCTAAGRALLRDFAGVLMADDYSVYRALQKARTRAGGVQTLIGDDGEITELWTPDYTLATCWMHARRYLCRADRYHDEVSHPLDLIGALYAVEDKVEAEIKRRLQQASGPVSIEEVQAWRIELRRSLRDAESRPIIDQIDAWRQSTRSLEGTALHEAIAHLDRIWDRLILVLDDPRIPLDNGHAERQQRGPVIGRKNFYGCRSEMGARVAALMFSLILSARNLGLDPAAYLAAAAEQAVLNPEQPLLPTHFAARMAAEAEAEAARA